MKKLKELNMQHEPAVQLGQDNAIEIKAKIGVWFFLLYLVVYSIFVLIAVTNYDALSKIVVLGQNLAVVYGFGLIVLAILMGIVYNIICTRYEDKMNKETE